jgi:hypothetical protein
MDAGFISGMKFSKSSKLWVAILAAGLFSGVLGVVEYGWNRGDSIGFAVWLLLAVFVGIVIRRDNRTLN